MNKFTALMSKINTFANLAIKSYRFSKFAAGMSIDDFTDTYISYNDDHDDPTISGLQKQVNKYINDLQNYAETIENVINGKFSDKLSNASALMTESAAFVSTFDALLSVLEQVTNSEAMSEMWMDNQSDNDSAPTLDKLLGFLDEGYKAVDEGILKLTGGKANMDTLSYSKNEQEDDGRTEAEKAFEDSGAVATVEEGIDGFSYSSNDQKKRDDYRDLKIRLNEAREAERLIPGYKSPLLEKMRQAQKKYMEKLKNDPEKLAAKKKREAEWFEKNKQTVGAKYDDLVNELEPIFAQNGFNIFKSNGTYNYREIARATDALINKYNDSSTNSKEIRRLLKNLEHTAKPFMRTINNIKTVTKHDRVMSENAAQGVVPDMLKKFQQDLSTSKLLMKKSLFDEMVKTIEDTILQPVMQKILEAKANNDEAALKSAKKELQNLVKIALERSPHYAVIKKEIMPIRKAMFDVYGGRASVGTVKTIKDVNQAQELLVKAKELYSKYGTQYTALTKWMPLIISGMERDLAGMVKTLVEDTIPAPPSFDDLEDESSDRKTIFAPPNFKEEK